MQVDMMVQKTTDYVSNVHSVAVVAGLMMLGTPSGRIR